MTLEPAMLERLMLDKAAGVLDADTAALLDAYLLHHPAARRELRAWEDLADRTHAALAHETPALPSFPQAQPARPMSAPWRAIWPALAAACLLGGILLGRVTHDAPTPPSQVSPVPAPPAPLAAQPSPVVRSVGAVQGFWSVDRLRAYATERADKGPASRTPITPGPLNGGTL